MMEKIRYMNYATLKPVQLQQLTSEHSNALNSTVNHTESNISVGFPIKSIGNMVSKKIHKICNVQPPLQYNHMRRSQQM